MPRLHDDWTLDAIVDAILEKDPNPEDARVAVETMVKTGVAIVAGEITTSAWVDIEEIVRNTVLEIGYNSSAMGFDGASCSVLNAIGKQSPDIAMGVDRENPEDQGAGDQGLMFGYASNETDVLMPAPITYAHRLVKRQSEVRKDGTLPYLRPDAKSQVTFVYEHNKPVAIDAIVVSSQHDPDVSMKDLREGVMEEIIKPIVPAELLSDKTKYHINPTGRFEIGGPMGDCGLTGRKIIVDTYGGQGSHGGGCFSGKDPSKVDRSASYMGRHIAKNIVAAGISKKCEIQIAYAIGVAEPVSVMVDLMGTGVVPKQRVEEIVKEVFDLRPAAIIEYLDLLRPIYRLTSAYGHFGRSEDEFSWEKTNKADIIREKAGI